MLKAIHASEDKEAAISKAGDICEKLRAMKLPKAAEEVKACILETLTYYDFPRSHRKRLRTNNPLERIMREIRRRTRVVCAFPDGNSALMLCAARLRHIAGTKWGTRKYHEHGPTQGARLESGDATSQLSTAERKSERFLTLS